MYNYGYSLQVGEGVDQSLKDAIKWYKKAITVDGSNYGTASRAYYRLGKIYNGAEGGNYGNSKKHVILAKKYFQDTVKYCSRQQLRELALVEIGYMHQRAKAYSKAIKYYKKAWRISDKKNW